jgi:hypothetical protein
VARDDAAKRAKLDAKNAQAIDISDPQHHRKHLRQSTFRDSRSQRSMRAQARRACSAVSERPVRGL